MTPEQRPEQARRAALFGESCYAGVSRSRSGTGTFCARFFWPRRFRSENIEMLFDSPRSGVPTKETQQAFRTRGNEDNRVYATEEDQPAWRAVVECDRSRAPGCNPHSTEVTQMTVKLVPLHDRILVRRVEEEETTRGGIVIPDTAKDKPKEG